MNNITLLVNSCDAYSDLWQPFFSLLKKNWVGELPPIVLNTETKIFSIDGIEIECPHCPNNPKNYYGKRMRYILSTIKTEYVLCMLDDFFIREPVNTEKICEVISYMEADHDICCFNFDDGFEGIESEKYPGYISRPQIAEYKLNMQAAVWRREDLRGFWKDKVNPWEWETISNKLTYHSDKKFFYLKHGETYPINYGKKPGLSWGVVRGKWIAEDVVPLFEKNEIQIDYTIRGFYKQIETKKTVNEHIERFLKKVYILGFAYMAKDFLVSAVWRRICILLGRKAQSYEAYLIEKYNSGK